MGYFIGMIGSFGFNDKSSGGQPIKTRELYDALCNRYGESSILYVDTPSWKNRPISFFVKCILLFFHSENIVCLPARNGIKVFAPLLGTLNAFFKKKIFYIVIGGWLTDLLKRNKILIIYIKKFNTVFVETTTMENSLKRLGIDNVTKLNNIKDLKVLNAKEISIFNEKPYKLCYFSRVVPEKGIEDAITVVRMLNENGDNEGVLCRLDIYGPVESAYRDQFWSKLAQCPSYIRYCGVVDPSDSVRVLKEYTAQLFPTHYATEGTPGSIIDSYFSAVPIIAAKWDSFYDVVQEGKTGIGYEMGNIMEFYYKLRDFLSDDNKIIKMKYDCLKAAEQYRPGNIIKKLSLFLEA